VEKQCRDLDHVYGELTIRQEHLSITNGLRKILGLEIGLRASFHNDTGLYEIPRDAITTQKNAITSYVTHVTA
jgi:hypothetical protein